MGAPHARRARRPRRTPSRPCFRCAARPGPGPAADPRNRERTAGRAPTTAPRRGRNRGPNPNPAANPAANPAPYSNPNPNPSDRRSKERTLGPRAEQGEPSKAVPQPSVGVLRHRTGRTFGDLANPEPARPNRPLPRPGRQNPARARPEAEQAPTASAVPTRSRRAADRSGPPWRFRGGHPANAGPKTRGAGRAGPRARRRGRLWPLHRRAPMTARPGDFPVDHPFRVRGLCGTAQRCPTSPCNS